MLWQFYRQALETKIFTVFALSARELNRRISVLVISPLKSIADQLAELVGISTATELLLLHKYLVVF